MIIVKIIGGVGNQLFQYAFGRSIESHTGIKVHYDIEDFTERYKLHKFSLQHFNIDINKAERKEINDMTSIYNRALFKLYKLNNIGLIDKKNLKYYRETGTLYDNDVFSLYYKNIYFDGYWQTEKYFKSISDIIRKNVTIVTLPTEINQAIIDKIVKVNAVSLHIRRSDYISNALSAKIYNTCSIDYYNEALSYIAERVDQPVFFVFSDDIEWAKNNLGNKYRMEFVDVNNADYNYEDLRLMSLCKHNIIGNSTFSWWGAWLNRSVNKIVIAPEKWFSNGQSSVDLIPENWMLF